MVEPVLNVANTEVRGITRNTRNSAAAEAFWKWRCRPGLHSFEKYPNFVRFGLVSHELLECYVQQNCCTFTEVWRLLYVIGLQFLNAVMSFRVAATEVPKLWRFRTEAVRTPTICRSFGYEQVVFKSRITIAGTSSIVNVFCVTARFSPFRERSIF